MVIYGEDAVAFGEKQRKPQTVYYSRSLRDSLRKTFGVLGS